jgi:aldehyde dehydrogenase (NAD+)
MKNADRFYIGGQWVDPKGDGRIDVINPATEEVIDRIPAGTPDDVDAAVRAAAGALEEWSRSSVADRAEALTAIAGGLGARADEIGEIVSAEMGMPIGLSKMIQAGLPQVTFANFAEIVQSYRFEHDQGTTRIVKEPAGVCGFITPWNFPLHQIAGKVAPAIAAGCTMVLKPSEVAPLDAVILAEVIDEIGLPPGVFNLVQGEGPVVGAAIASHPGIDMVSFTGSTRAGVSVAVNAADNCKRVAQELGGKSANIILDDADFETAVSGGVRTCFLNSGQACNSPTRMLVPADRQEEAVAIAKAAAEETRVGDPSDSEAYMGPLVSQAQFDKVQRLIQEGIDAGAQLVTGGPGRPEGFDTGYYVRPTVFASVSNDMTIAQEEIFGPVLSIIPYRDEEDAVRIANDTIYGLSGYVSAADVDRARRVAARLRTGQVHINGAQFDPGAPFGGYKMSGNGREFGEWGLEEFLETKALLGYSAP